jgi:predicted dehydrogenase
MVTMLCPSERHHPTQERRATMPRSRSRREFMRNAALTGLGMWMGGSAFAQDTAEQKLRFACIGVGGKGESDTADAARFGEVVAICDVDETILGKAGEKYPMARRFTDFREMLSEMRNRIDAVTVSTPDHTHAAAAAMAMNLGKHCFCQKPLAHSIYEARQLAEIARAKKVATQMGNQGTASGTLRKSAALVKAGVLGPVREVHVWTNRPVWPQGDPRPEPADTPSTLHWDLWLGPAPERPYGKGYHPFGWRGWWDFGTGALGDMACHTFNMPFMALDLRNPTSVVAETSGHNRDSYPKWSIIHFEFPATDTRPAVPVTWYDGGKLPPEELLKGQRLSRSGALLIGEKGFSLYSPGDYAEERVLLGGAQEIEVSYPSSPGHFEEFVRAIKSGEPAMSNFPDYAGPLTETILLGNLAVWADGKKIEWDAKNLVARNAPEVRPVIQAEYRKGWSLR